MSRKMYALLLVPALLVPAALGGLTGWLIMQVIRSFQ
jgi:hypothetical protein